MQRLDNHEDPLDSEPLGKPLPGVHKLNDEDRDFWYRLLYWFHAGWIYVLHCFKKKTNKIPQGDIEIARKRKSDVLKRNDAPALKSVTDEEKKSA